MLAELTSYEIERAIGASIANVLAITETSEPPFDPAAIARRLGMLVVNNSQLQGRAQFVRKVVGQGRHRDVIIVGAHDRLERRHWTIAHEVGEWLSSEVFANIGITAEEIPTAGREQMANWIANRMLLPEPWFSKRAKEVDWDLMELKNIFSTASHELIARRMLDMKTAVLITIFDQGKLHYRQSNFGIRVPNCLDIERSIWSEVHSSGKACQGRLDCTHPSLCETIEAIACWPIHEPGWKREIMRTELRNLEMD